MMHTNLHRRRIALITFTLLVSAGCERGAADKPAPTPEPPEPRESAEEVIARATAFYESRESFERPKPYSEVPDGLANMRAETCGACHQEIYKEWALSTHRRAWLDDAQFQDELKKSRGAHDPNAGDVGWMCVNCHTPAMQQLPQLVVGLEDGQINKPIYVDNPTFDAEMQEDAITCAACHVRDGVVYGPYGDSNAPHPVKRGEFLMDEQVCTSCHQAEQHYKDQNLACFFSTGREWQGSKYPDDGQTCQSCHMPEVTRKVAENFDVPARKTRRHWFGGSLIPKKPEFAAELEPLRKVYGSGVTFSATLSPEAKRPAQREPANIDEASWPELFECEGEACEQVLVKITNDRAGHYMPSGDPERHIEVVVEARSATGDVLARGYDVIGSRYEWWPETRLVRDTRVPPHGHRELWLSVPREAKTLHITADKWRMYKGAFEHHHLEGRYVRGRRFHESTWELDVGAKKLSLGELVDDMHPGDESENGTNVQK